MTRQEPAVKPAPEVAPAPTTSSLSFIGYWGVVIAWMAVISLMSTEPFSAANTNHYIDPVLRFFFPDMRQADFVFAHTVIRKTAHLTEFFVLGSLLYWACRRGRMPRWRATWMVQALLVALLYSLLDEFHQVFVPNRTPSLADSGIDSLGAGISQAFIYLRHVVLSRFSLLH
jgi:VanZ family protein